MKMLPVSSIALLFCASTGALTAGSASWVLDPINFERWHEPPNWMPQTVPDGPDDIATFGVSNGVRPTVLSGITELHSAVFLPGASSYTFELFATLTFSGAGIVNDSGVMQSVLAAGTSDARGGIARFTDQATAGISTVFHVICGQSGTLGASLQFSGSANAGEAQVINLGAFDADSTGGSTTFTDRSRAASATITNTGARSRNGGRATTTFFDSTSADAATIFNEAAQAATHGSATQFFAKSTAAKGTFRNGGADSPGEGGGRTEFFEESSAGDAVLINVGATARDAGEGFTRFADSSLAANAKLITHDAANGNSGGSIQFANASSGNTAQVKLSDYGKLEISEHDAPGVSLGSLEGSGSVLLGARNLTIGTNNSSSIFSGSIQDGGTGGTGGSITKTGGGTLRLSGANSYTGGTVVNSGRLEVSNKSGSGTGGGEVRVEGGLLAGRGIIAGPALVGGTGMGAVLAPGEEAIVPATLVMQSTLTLKADSRYVCRLLTSRAKSDQVVANGVTIENGAQFEFKALGNRRLRPGKSAVLISNTSANPIAGTFANLADGSTLSAGPNEFQVSYAGGDGNDLALTVLH